MRLGGNSTSDDRAPGCAPDLHAKHVIVQVIYLHGNKISKLTDVKKLATLPNLTKLTLHGNPIAEMPVYRLYIPAHIPALKSLDFGSITKVDRDRINTWNRGHMKRVEEH